MSEVLQLPDASNTEMDILESSFFRSRQPGACLPTPAEVRALVQPHHRNLPRPPPVVFENLNMLVKFGTDVAIAEAQNLWYIRKVFGSAVPVPELFGWRANGSQIFIYMELIHGQTLKAQWEILDNSERISVCGQLRQILASLRSYRQNYPNIFIGSINRQPLLDMVFVGQPQVGPFPNVSKFNDYFAYLQQQRLPASERYIEPYRHLLPDTGLITLSHGDLHHANILLSVQKPRRVLAIVNWAHAGWYPDYWEYCRAAHTCTSDGDWRNKWIPQFIYPRLQEHEVYAEYVAAIGVF